MGPACAAVRRCGGAVELSEAAREDTLKDVLTLWRSVPANVVIMLDCRCWPRRTTPWAARRRSRRSACC